MELSWHGDEVCRGDEPTGYKVLTVRDAGAIRYLIMKDGREIAESASLAIAKADCMKYAESEYSNTDSFLRGRIEALSAVVAFLLDHHCRTRYVNFNHALGDAPKRDEISSDADFKKGLQSQVDELRDDLVKLHQKAPYRFG